MLLSDKQFKALQELKAPEGSIRILYLEDKSNSCVEVQGADFNVRIMKDGSITSLSPIKLEQQAQINYQEKLPLAI